LEMLRMWLQGGQQAVEWMIGIGGFWWWSHPSVFLRLGDGTALRTLALLSSLRLIAIRYVTRDMVTLEMLMQYTQYVS
jgi:hypothetical protein